MPDLRRARRDLRRWIRSVPHRVRRLPDALSAVPRHLRGLPGAVRRLPRTIRGLNRRQWVVVIMCAAALVGVVAGLIAFTGGDPVRQMSKEEFVAEFKRVTDKPPDDKLLGCLFDRMDGDRTLQLEALKEQAAPDSAERLQQIAEECRLEGSSRGTQSSPRSTVATSGSNPGSSPAPRSSVPPSPRTSATLDTSGIPPPPPPNNPGSG